MLQLLRKLIVVLLLKLSAFNEVTEKRTVSQPCCAAVSLSVTVLQFVARFLSQKTCLTTIFNFVQKCRIVFKKDPICEVGERLTYSGKIFLRYTSLYLQARKIQANMRLMKILEFRPWPWKQLQNNEWDEIDSAKTVNLQFLRFQQNVNVKNSKGK